MKMKIKLIEDYEDKQKIARQLLEALPEWFGIEEARENYIKDSTDVYKRQVQLHM